MADYTSAFFLNDPHSNSQNSIVESLKFCSKELEHIFSLQMKMLPTEERLSICWPLCFESISWAGSAYQVSEPGNKKEIYICARIFLIVQYSTGSCYPRFRLKY